MSDAVQIQLIVSIASVLVAIASTCFAYMAHKAAKETHTLFNSRMTELMRLAKAAAKAEGVKEEKERQKPRR